MSVGTAASLSASAYLTTEALKIKPDRGGYEAREGEQKNKIFWLSAGNHKTTSWIS